jgi:sulfite reductase (NADPH) flavoprotein alpha-component
MIMVATGAGLAPFLGFLERREHLWATDEKMARSWLFFGSRNRSVDFLCGDALLEWQKTGILDRLNPAFSRDQPEKIYVQDKMRENGEELWQWLVGGASVYVCGNARGMADDVHRALLQIVANHGHGDPEQFIDELRRTKRYLRDVY